MRSEPCILKMELRFGKSTNKDLLNTSEFATVIIDFEH